KSCILNAKLVQADDWECSRILALASKLCDFERLVCLFKLKRKSAAYRFVSFNVFCTSAIRQSVSGDNSSVFFQMRQKLSWKLVFQHAPDDTLRRREPFIHFLSVKELVDRQAQLDRLPRQGMRNIHAQRSEKLVDNISEFLAQRLSRNSLSNEFKPGPQ